MRARVPKKEGFAQLPSDHSAPSVCSGVAGHLHRCCREAGALEEMEAHMLEKQAVASGWAACWAVGCAGESSDAIRAIQTARAEQRNTAMLLVRESAQ